MLQIQQKENRSLLHEEEECWREESQEKMDQIQL